MKFYVTIAASQPRGSGYYEVRANTEAEARKIVFDNLGQLWSFIYSSLEDVHPLDRKKHGVLS